MWGRKTSETGKPLRKQLLEAQAALKRQIEIIDLGGIRYSYQPGLKETLQEELNQVNDALADLGPEGA